MRWFVSSGVVALVACGPKPGIKKFVAQPGCVCRGHAATVSWTVIGRPVITFDPKAPRDWPANTPLASCDSRPVHFDETTNLTLTVPDANPADGHAQLRQEVKVVDGTGSGNFRATQCTEQMVVGELPSVSSCGAPVARMHEPVVQGPGAEKAPRKICLVPPGAAPICVEAGQSADVGAVLGEGWKIQIPLKEGESCDPGKKPTVATVQLDLDCDQTH